MRRYYVYERSETRSTKRGMIRYVTLEFLFSRILSKGVRGRRIWKAEVSRCSLGGAFLKHAESRIGLSPERITAESEDRGTNGRVGKRKY